MFNASGSLIPSVLIVENKSGNVFIVENKSSKPQVEKILKNNSYTTKKKDEVPSSSKTKREKKTKPREPSPIPLKQEIKDEPEEIIDDDDFPDDFPNYNYSSSDDDARLVDSKVSFEAIQIKLEPKIKTEDAVKAPKVEATFDGNWSSDNSSGDDSFNNNFPDSDDEPLIKFKEDPEKKKKRSKKKSDTASKGTANSYKTPLTGKIACKYCETVFASKNESHEHVCKYLTSDKKNFICRICFKELSKGTFSNHTHNAAECKFCGREFVNPRNMRRHIESVHKYENMLYEVESKSMLVPPPIVKTLSNRYSHKKGKFECDHCGKCLVSLNSMFHHMQMHTGVTDKICTTCGSKFFTQKGLNRHTCGLPGQLSKGPSNYDLCYCRYCDTSFESYGKNKAHICPYKNSADPLRVICRICNNLVGKKVYKRHIDMHDGVRLVCPICGKSFATRRNYKLHMSTHTGNKPYKCTFCTESFISKIVLELHLRFHNTAPVATLHCEYCSKEFTHQRNLKRHIFRLHSQVILCELCKATFESREELTYHMETSHEPFVCTFCSKTFKLSRYLKMHEKVHNDSAERLECPYCSKMYIHKKIKQHVFNVHKDQFSSWSQSNPTL